MAESTGRSKGVAVEHGSLVNFLQSTARISLVAAGETLLAVTTVSFDIAGLELWLPLTVGAACVIATKEEVTSPDELANLIETHEVDVLQATPATWQMLVNSGWIGAPGLRARRRRR